MADNRKPRGPNSWKKTELMRALRAAKDEHTPLARVEIEGGKISLVLNGDGDGETPEDARNL